MSIDSDIKRALIAALGDGREAVLSQALAIHHPSCAQAKRLLRPRPVTVVPAQNDASYGTLIATLPSGKKDRVWAAGCCSKHYETRDVYRTIWRDG